MKAESKFQKDIRDIANRIERMGKEIQAYQLADRLLDGIDLSDCAYVSASMYDSKVSITLNLDSDKRDSRIAHRIVQKLHCKFEKKQSYYKDSLELTATIPGDDSQYPYIPEFSIEINGSVPKTCKLVTHEIPLTDEEIEEAKAEALANVKLVRVEREIICK